MKKIMFDDSMGAAGDMLAAALLDLFDDPDSVVQDLNKIIKDGNLEDVIAQVVKQVRDNVEGLEFDVTVDDEMEEPEDVHPHEYFEDRVPPFFEEFIPHRHPHPEHRHCEEHDHPHDHFRDEYYHRHPEEHDHFREEHYHRRPCPHPHGEMRRPGCRRGPHPRPFEPGRPFISGPIELHFHLHLEGDICKKSKKKHHRHHHHHHHGKHELGCRERKNRRSRRNRRPQVKKDTSVKVSKDHFN